MTVTCLFPFLIGSLVIATVGLPVEKKTTTPLDLEGVPSFLSVETTERYVADKFQENQGLFNVTTPGLEEMSSKDNSTDSRQPTDAHIDELTTEGYSRMNIRVVATTESEKEMYNVTKTATLEEFDSGVADTMGAVAESSGSREVLCTEPHEITNEGNEKDMSSSSTSVITRAIDLQIVSAQDFVLKKLSAETLEDVEEFYILKKTKNTNISHDIVFEVALNVTEVDEQLLKDTQLNVGNYTQNEVVTFNRTIPTVQVPPKDKTTQNTGGVTSIIMSQMIRNEEGETPKTIITKESTSGKNISGANQSVDMTAGKNISETDDSPLNITTLETKGDLISINTNVDASRTKENSINMTGINDALEPEYNLKNTVLEKDVLDPDDNPFDMLNATEKYIWELEKNRISWIIRKNLSDVKENISEMTVDKNATNPEELPSHMFPEVSNTEKNSPVMVSEKNILIPKYNLPDVISEKNISVLKNNLVDISFENNISVLEDNLYDINFEKIASDLDERPSDMDMKRDILNSTISPPGLTKAKRLDELIKETKKTDSREENQNITSGNTEVSTEMGVY